MNMGNIYIEGSIATGKSTLFNLLKNSCLNSLDSLNLVEEPIDDWTNFRSQFNLLKIFDENPQRFSFLFQSYVMLSLAKSHDSILNSSKRVLAERSIFSSRHVFIENLWRGSLLNEVEYSILDDLYKYYSLKVRNSSLIVYLRAEPETLFSRILNRGREGERNLTLSYLKNLDNLHEKWIDCQRSNEISIITINTEKSESDTIKDFNKCLEFIIDFINGNIIDKFILFP